MDGFLRHTRDAEYAAEVAEKVIVIPAKAGIQVGLRVLLRWVVDHALMAVKCHIPPSTQSTGRSSTVTIIHLNLERFALLTTIV